LVRYFGENSSSNYFKDTAAQLYPLLTQNLSMLWQAGGKEVGNHKQTEECWKDLQKDREKWFEDA
jgi:hypothetical protein